MTRSIYVSLLFSSLLFSCSKDDNKAQSATVSDITFSSCNNSFKSSISDSVCVTATSTEANYLTFTHKGAEFCCATEKMDVELAISGDTIFIHEVDKGPMSYCFCEHDLSYTFGPLEYGKYEVKIIESENSYNRDTIMFELNHSLKTNFTNCK